MGIQPNHLCKLERILGYFREPDGFFFSTFPGNTYLLNTYYILNPTLGIMDILKRKNMFSALETFTAQQGGNIRM